MKTKGKAWKLKNKGFTLIEMIVTVAIIAIFSGVVVTFIGTGSGVYRNTSSNSKVQMETQETFDKIEDLIIDANRSLYYANGSGSEIGAEIRNDIKEKGGINSTGNKTFIACNEYENGDGSSQYIYDVLDWQASDAKIYYSCREYTAASSTDKDTNDDQETETFSDESGENPVTDGNSSTTSTKARNAKTLVERSVLATGILDFRADVSKVESDKIVRFQLSTENGKKQIQTLHSVSLRNNVDLKKPSDAFDKAESTDVGIRIINAPESMDPGESTMLAYGLTGNGSIDPTTVTWLVVENDANGSFPPQDHTNSRLTISENGSGYIRVKVTAVSTTGQRVESQVVTIKINAKPTSLISDVKKILIAAGASYDLSSNITWSVLYSDMTTSSTGNLSWDVKGCNYASITSSGVLSVSADAGTADKGTVLVTVTDAEHEDVYGTLEVSIARIDLTLPGNGATYEVGNNKQLKCTYMEGGNVVETVEDNRTPQIITVITEQKPNNASEYSVDGTFTQNDIGTWTIKAAVNLSVRENQGYDLTFGIVNVANTFRVDSRNSGTGQIIVHGDLAYDTVIAGREYDCSGYNPNDFYFSTADTNLNINNVQSINWSFKGDHPGVTFKPESAGATNQTLVIDKNACHGFTLCADYVGVLGYDNGKAITVQLYAERTFKVANGIEFNSLSGDTAYVYGPDESEDYLTQVLLDVYDINGVKSQINVSETNDTILHWEDLGSDGAKMTFDGEHWRFHASATDVGKTQNIKVKLQQFKNVYDTKNTYYAEDNDNFIKKISVKVVLTYTAEIVALNNKNSLFPGESTELYLRLKNMKGLLNAQVHWKVDTQSAINFEYNNSYQESTYENGKEIPIKISADTKITEPTTVTLTADYTIKNVGTTTGTKSIQLTITPLTMNLIASAVQTYYGDEPVAITADIVDAQHDQHVTDDYDIEWSLSPEDVEIYTIGNVSGKETSLSIKKAPDSIRTVTVTATAKDKNSKAVICSSSIRIAVSPKITIEKAYSCAASQEQKLEFNDSDKGKNVEKIKTSYMSATIDALTECEKNQLPFLTLNDTDTSNLSITMSADTSDYENYKYDLVSVDMGDVLYNFYIYPLQNNVYDCEYGQDTGVVPYTYVPTDIESIRRLGVLGSNDDADKSYPGYTYTYTDTLKESCYLRFSVYNKTGAGVISNNYVDSSAQKWFMKRKAQNKNDGENYTYYRLYGNKWYKFHSLGKIKKEQYGNNEVLYNKEKANRTRYYWDLKDDIHLYDDNGKELEGRSPVGNIYFWQKWQ